MNCSWWVITEFILQLIGYWNLFIITTVLVLILNDVFEHSFLEQTVEHLLMIIRSIVKWIYLPLENIESAIKKKQLDILKEHKHHRLVFLIEIRLLRNLIVFHQFTTAAFERALYRKIFKIFNLCLVPTFIWFLKRADKAPEFLFLQMLIDTLLDVARLTDINLPLCGIRFISEQYI